MPTLADEFIARRQANRRPMRPLRHQPPHDSKDRNSATSSCDLDTPRNKTQDIKIEAESRSAHQERSSQQAVLPLGAFSSNRLVETPRDKASKSDGANPASSGMLQYVATTESSPISSLYPQRQSNQPIITTPPVHNKTTSAPLRKLAPTNPGAVKSHHLFVFITITVLLASLWWSQLGLNRHSLVARHASIDTSVQTLGLASETLNNYRFNRPACIPTVENSISQSIILLDRDVRNAADIAVRMLGVVILSIPHSDTKIEHGLSCLQTSRLAAKLDDVAQQCSHVAGRHKEALAHTRNASSELGDAVRSIIAERNKLHASRKNKHRQALEHVKELMGLPSDVAIDKTVARYKEMADAIRISEKAWNETVTATSIQHREYAVWKSVVERLQDLEINLRDKADMRRRAAACLNASEIREVLRVLDVEMQKVIM